MSMSPDIFHRNPSVVNSNRAISISFRSSVQWIYMFTFISFSLQAHGIQEFFFFIYSCKEIRFDTVSSDIFPFRSPLLLALQGPEFVWSHLSQLHLDNQHTHFILVKISLNRFITDGCSCDQCLQSDDKLEIKACHHYLINLKLSTFWSHSLPFHKPRRAAKTVPGVLIDSGSHHRKAGASLAVTLKSNTMILTCLRAETR